MTEAPAIGKTGFLLYSPFSRKYFFRIYDQLDKSKFVDYDLRAEDIEITILDNFTALYEPKDDNSFGKLDYNSEVLGRKPNNETCSKMEPHEFTEKWYVWKGSDKQRLQFDKCEKCGKQPFSNYMVKNELWPQEYRFLCLDCCQTIVGRKITIDDFLPCQMTNLVKLGYLLGINQYIDLKDF